ncbi:MAG: AAA family ATPase [Clostridium sp.]|uniref:AAA family ATPase n=1 Tax=Clostridium sp. TaxID=1506 RepID=UPI003D6D5B0C
MNGLFLVQMSGLPGSGKSTIAKAIAKNTGAIVIDLDIVKSSILESFKGDIDFKLAGKVSYDILFSLADYYLSQERNVIIDTPCGYTELLERGNSLCSKYNANYKYVEAYILNLEEINQRLKNRERHISQIFQVDSEITNNDDYRKLINIMKRPNNIKYLTVDTSQPLESYLEKVVNYLFI